MDLRVVLVNLTEDAEGIVASVEISMPNSSCFLEGSGRKSEDPHGFLTDPHGNLTGRVGRFLKDARSASPR